MVLCGEETRGNNIYMKNRKTCKGARVWQSILKFTYCLLLLFLLEVVEDE